MYSIIKGNMFRMYNGEETCTGLSVHAIVETKEEARAIVRKLFDTETDLILVVDLQNGLQCDDI